MIGKDSNTTPMNCHLAIVSLLFILFGCAIREPVTYKTPGVIETHFVTTFLGLPVSTRIERCESPEATKARLAREKAEKEQARELEEAGLKLRQQKRQGDTAHWLGLGLLIGAIGCVVMGCIMDGWKGWGILAVVLGVLGVVAWGLAQAVPLLRWVVVPVVAACVLLFMHRMRDFSAANWIRERKQNKNQENDNEQR